jgi:transcriptional regulator with XRE-family HTH domain
VLSALAGVSLSFLSDVERGDKEISSEALFSICKSFSIELDTLLDKASSRYRLLRQIDNTFSGN